MPLPENLRSDIIESAETTDAYDWILSLFESDPMEASDRILPPTNEEMAAALNGALAETK